MRKILSDRFAMATASLQSILNIIQGLPVPRVASAFAFSDPTFFRA